jgi:hypothetical protein
MQVNDIDKIALLQAGVVATGDEAKQLYNDVRFLQRVMEAGYALVRKGDRLFLKPASKHTYVMLKAGEIAALALDAGFDMAQRLVGVHGGRHPTHYRRVLAKALGSAPHIPTAEEADNMTDAKLLNLIGLPEQKQEESTRELAHMLRAALRQRTPVHSRALIEAAMWAYKELMGVPA